MFSGLQGAPSRKEAGSPGEHRGHEPEEGGAGRLASVFGGQSAPWILTPHPGEAAALLTTDTATVQEDRFAAVRALQARWGGSVLLKGSGSLTCDGETVGLCTEGNPGMAGGGMGDVLSGLIAGLLAQGMAPPEALRYAVAVHGEAADLASADGERGMLATDLLPHIRRLLNRHPLGAR